MTHSRTTDSCVQVRAAFSDYLDGAVTGHSMHAIADHLKSCADCSSEFDSWQTMQQALSSLRTTKAPADLGLKLRVALSQEKAKRDAHWGDHFAVRWENAVRPMLIQASAGLAATLLLIGTLVLMLGIVPPPQAVLADDVPLGAMTPPHYLYSASSPRPIFMGRDTTIIVDAAINAHGQVYDYRIVSAPQSTQVQRQIAEQLMLSVFEPARVFGAPVRGRVIVTFDGISVHG